MKNSNTTIEIRLECSNQYAWFIQEYPTNVELPVSTLSGHKRVPKSAYKKLTKIWSETMVFSRQLRQLPQIILLWINIQGLCLRHHLIV